MKQVSDQINPDRITKEQFYSILEDKSSACNRFAKQLVRGGEPKTTLGWGMTMKKISKSYHFNY